ncbi:MAG: hypothetical protein Unbinned3065contig1002_36 [Prokaryotic dsDNA virus sp.]|jgi:hypothetical protein|nr:MAG: hypothetical protein Unbinned3065contig1002_36 [Prokaryotic dsDNA virus sp.]
MPRSSAERQREYEERKKEAGWSRIAVWVAPKVDREQIKKYVSKLNKKAS